MSDPEAMPVPQPEPELELEPAAELAHSAHVNAKPAAPKLTLDILSTITAAQALHGMRFHDYKRYRRCARIRHAMKFVSHHARGTKTLVMRQVTAAERSWAHAMERKEDVSKRAVIATRSHLRKAVKWAKQLHNLCIAVADDRTTLEAAAYAAWCYGNSYLECEKHEDALKEYGHAQSIFEKLMKTSTAVQRQLCVQKISEITPNIRYCRYTLERDGVSREELLEMQAGLRGDAATSELLKAKLDSLQEEWRAEHADGLATVVMRDGVEVTVPSGAVRDSFLKIQDACQELRRGYADSTTNTAAVLDLYSTVVNAHTEALAMLEKEIKNQSKIKPKPKTGRTGTAGAGAGAGAGDSALLQEYVRRGIQIYSLARFRLTAAQLTRPSSTSASASEPVDPVQIVNLYEKAGDCIDSLMQLGVTKDTNEYYLLKARREGYIAQRCFYVAKSYEYESSATSSLAKLKLEAWTKVSALLSRCDERASEAIQNMTDFVDQDADAGAGAGADAGDALGENDVFGYEAETDREVKREFDELCKLRERVRAERVRLMAREALEGHDVSALAEAAAALSLSADEEKRVSGGRGLLGRLKEYDAGDPAKHHDIVEFPPGVEAIAAKPIVFDLAGASIHPPDLEARTKAKSKKSGWLPFWG